MRIAYIDGRYRSVTDEAITIQDRGFQFADGVYEVILVIDGRLIDAGPHLDRLERSLREISLSFEQSRPALTIIMQEVIRRNRVRDGMIYVQITRGRAERNLAFPRSVRPTVVVTARPMRFDAGAPRGIRVITTPDIRWARVDIKSIALLPNLLAKNAAVSAGFDDVWFVDRDGFVTEASGANAWIVNRQRELITRPLSTDILHGITRATLLSLVTSCGVKFIERKFSVAEAHAASEAFISSATALLTPVVEIDRTAIGDGQLGPVTRRLIDDYRVYWRKTPEISTLTRLAAE